jgi:hypothetical protein
MGGFWIREERPSFLKKRSKKLLHRGSRVVAVGAGAQVQK